jgi:transposase-like protein
MPRRPSVASRAKGKSNGCAVKGDRPERRWRSLASGEEDDCLAMVERQGRVRATVVKGRDAATLKGEIHEHVLPASTIFTDEWPAYHGLAATYRHHHRIRHSEKIYVSGEIHTQTIEGFFCNLKRGIDGTYHVVSTQWLQGYLNEFVWRYNGRNDVRSRFHQLVLRAAL